MTTIAVLMTCHNRRSFTVASLEALRANDFPQGVTYRVVLVDDGCTDGTAEEVAARFPEVKILKGDGTLYWSQGMRWAWEEASKQGADFYLWLNDDTTLCPDAIRRLLSTHEEVAALSGRGAIVVGSTKHRTTGELSYGGVRRRSWLRPVTFDRVRPGDSPIRCDTIEGNVVLVPAPVAVSLGNITPAFIHAMGDTDYGLRAQKAGFANWVMPGFAGVCSDNTKEGTFGDSSLPLKHRLRHMLQPKGLPVKPWLELTRRHTGPLWLVYWAWPYVRVIMGSILGR